MIFDFSFFCLCCVDFGWGILLVGFYQYRYIYFVGVGEGGYMLHY